MVDYTGVEAKAEDHLVEIYSPQLAAAEGDPQITPHRSDTIEMIRNKLRRWKLTDEQIDESHRTKQVPDRRTAGDGSSVKARQEPLVSLYSSHVRASRSS